MPFTRNVGPDEGAFLDTMADLLARPREIGFLVSERFRWVPAPGSRAAVEFGAKLFPEDYNASLVSRPRENASIYLTDCANHLAGLGALYRDRELWTVPGVLARAAVEHGARAVLALDPRIELRDRVARAVLDDAVSAHFSQQAVGALGGKETPQYVLTKEKSDSIRRVARECFSPVSFADNPPGWSIEGLRQFGYAKSVESWCDWRDDDVAGRGVYAALSLYTHPQTLAAHEEATFGHSPTGGLRTDVVKLRKLASAAFAAWYDGMTLLTSYHGWEVEELDAIERDAVVLLSDAEAAT